MATRSEPTVGVLTTAEDVAVSVSPLRRRLLAMLDAPASAAGLARRLGLPRQRVNYHLRELEQAGLVRLVEERPRRGVTERLLVRSDDLILVDPLVVLPGGLPARDATGIAGIIAAVRDTLNEIAAVARRAARTRQRAAVATVQATVRLAGPADLRGLTAALGDLVAAHDAPADRSAVCYRVTLLVHPVPADPDDPRRHDRPPGGDFPQPERPASFS